jgi:hypothetical protein
MLVVMTDVNPEDAFEVPSVDDQDPVETFAADCADPPFDEGVRPGCAYGVRIVRMPPERNTSSKAAVNVLPRSWIRNRIGSVRSTNVSIMFRACWVVHSPVGFAVIHARYTCRVESSMNTSA